jgi:hypothetical protein
MPTTRYAAPAEEREVTRNPSFHESRTPKVSWNHPDMVSGPLPLPLLSCLPDRLGRGGGPGEQRGPRRCCGAPRATVADEEGPFWLAEAGQF